MEMGAGPERDAGKEGGTVAGGPEQSDLERRRAGGVATRGSILWKLAWRNLWRHRTRTLIMGSAVAFIYALTLLGMGINDDGHARMLDEATSAAGGDILVHGAGYWDSRSSDRIIESAEPTLDAVRTTQGVRAAIPRILINGLLSTSSASSAVYLQGIRTELEATVTDYRQDLVEGTFLDGPEDDPLVLGIDLADRLELELGDRVVLTASDPDGEMVRALFHLSGIVETGTRELDQSLGFTTLEAAAASVGMEGSLTQIGVLTEEDVGEEEIAGVAERIREAVGAVGAGSAESTVGTNGGDGGLEVLTWREAVPEMVGFIELDDAFGVIYMVVLLVVVLFSIANTFLMAVMERVRELGLLNALGLRGNGIGRLLLAETVLLTGLAMSLGFVLGYGGHVAVSHWGISVAGYGLDEIQISGVDLSDLVFYSTIDPSRWITATLLVAAATVASALYPAWRASRLAPAEAMRFFE